MKKKFRLVQTAVVSICVVLYVSPIWSAPKMNVLFIIVDDLRTELGTYGHYMVKSPNIDRLAAKGIRFDRAYAQQSSCSPSRISLLSGRRPDTTGIIHIGPRLKDVHPEFDTLPGHFKDNGYETVSIGKVYHHRDDDPDAWSVEPWRPKVPKYHDARSIAEQKQAFLKAETRYKKYYKKFKELGKLNLANRLKKPKRKGVRGPSHESPDVADDAYANGMFTNRAIEEMNRLKDKPFFIAVGFTKPHLPFNAPKRYWDLYNPDEIRLPETTEWPLNIPDVAKTTSAELRGYSDIPSQAKLDRIGYMDEEKVKRLIHGYYASVSYSDAQIGHLLDELDRLKLSDNTIVVVWGDHGWKLGEFGAWGKHTNFEIDNRVPLIIYTPGLKSAGKRSALVELVDIGPTLLELVDLPVPEDWEGTSMLPLLSDHDRSWKTAVFSQNPLHRTMGYTMRTNRYRYVEWIDGIDGKVKARELYDLSADSIESKNIVDNPENAKLVKRMHEKMKGGWKAARPDG